MKVIGRQEEHRICKHAIPAMRHMQLLVEEEFDHCLGDKLAQIITVARLSVDVRENRDG